MKSRATNNVSHLEHTCGAKQVIHNLLLLKILTCTLEAFDKAKPAIALPVGNSTIYEYLQYFHIASPLFPQCQ